MKQKERWSDHLLFISFVFLCNFVTHKELNHTIVRCWFVCLCMCVFRFTSFAYNLLASNWNLQRIKKTASKRRQKKRMKCVIYAKYQDKLQNKVANVLAIDANGTTKWDGMTWISLMLEIRHKHTHTRKERKFAQRRYKQKFCLVVT